MESLMMNFGWGWLNGRSQESNAVLTVRKQRMRSGYFYLFLALVSLIIIGIVDWRMANRISLIPFYTIPVIIATVMVGRMAGIGVSVMGSLVWLLADLGDGSMAYDHTLTPYWNALVRLSVFVLVVGAIVLRKALQQEKIQARVDPLTGILNRRAFYELAAREVARSRRYSRPVSLVLFDCNGFKQINDRFGHRTGDKVLHYVGEAIRENVRNEDIAARWGGDEFIVLLPETDYMGVVKFVNRLNEAFKNFAQQEVKGISSSFGIKSYATAPLSIDEMVSSADGLMYVAKRSGVLYEAGNNQEEGALVSV